MQGIMIQGCSSDAGKSYVATALCRVLADKGFHVSPFKSQNMANNSYVTWDGGEIGRAQGVQAEAAGVRPETYMNPILLKPRQETGSEIVLFGQVLKTMPGSEYHRSFTMTEGLQAVRKGLQMIAEKYDMIVIEGAGSPAEVNLNAREIVNMRVAREADVPVLLVVDINRGGSFAAIVGTLELLGEDRRRVKGLIFNQFRGDLSLFEDGVRWIEDYTGIKVVGVLPYLEDVHIEGEDSLSINFQHISAARPGQAVELGIVRLPYISNHTDMEIFQYEQDINIRFIDDFTALENFDAIIIPGTKSTIGDLLHLEQSGLAERLRNYQGFVFGICGGYQMLGEQLIDEDGVDFQPGTVKAGLGLLPLTTRFQAQKSVSQVQAVGCHPLTAAMPVEGYEIHLGCTELNSAAVQPLWQLAGGEPEGAATADLHQAGSYLHNVFHNDNFRTVWLNQIRRAKGLPERPLVDTQAQKEAQYQKLADYARQYLDMDYIMSIINKEV